jgi:hypothetical protein
VNSPPHFSALPVIAHVSLKCGQIRRTASARSCVVYIAGHRVPELSEIADLRSCTSTQTPSLQKGVVVLTMPPSDVKGFVVTYIPKLKSGRGFRPGRVTSPSTVTEEASFPWPDFVRTCSEYSALS